jgi:membrane fusion protein (multidrug efflux system)
MYSKFYSGLLIAASLLLAATGCSKKDEGQQATATQAPAPVAVTVSTAQKVDVAYYDEYPGSVIALDEVELRPQVSGFITGVHFKDGARVKKGQLLYSIDSQLYSANYDQAQANLKVQEANLIKAQKDADRYHELAKNDAVAKQLVDNADAALAVAKSQVEAAKSSIQAVQTNVRYTRVVAPFSGLIGISLVKVGAAVTAGQTILNTVSTDNNLAVDFNVDQKEIFRFANMLKNQLQDSTFMLSFNSEVYPHPGKLALIDRAVSSTTGTIKARLIFPNPDGLLRSGMNGAVRVRNQSSEAVIIPHKAVTEQLGEFFVYVPNDSNVVTQKQVVLGRAVGENIIVRNGLNEGERIVVEGIQNLREGSLIKTDNQ